MDDRRIMLQTSCASEREAVLDPSTIERLVQTCGEGGGAVVAALLGAFFDDAPRHLATLRQSIAGGVVADVQRAAHTLKSHGFTFGAPLLAHLAAEVECMAKERVLDGVAAVIDELEDEYRKARWGLELVRLDLLEADLEQAA